VTIFDGLRHRLRAAVRAPFVERRALSLILGGFMALYLGGGLVLFGLFFDDLVRNVAPGHDPLLVASRGLLPLGLLYAAVRVFTESGLGADVRPYLTLPFRRSVLAGAAAVLALFRLWNAVPLAFVVTVSIESAVDGALGPALRFGLVSMAVLAVVTYAVPMLRQLVSKRPLLTAMGVLLVVASAGLEWIDVWGRVGSLLDVSGWVLGGVVQGHMASEVTFVAGVGGGVYAYARWLHTAMALDAHSQPARAASASSDVLGRLARRGPIWREAVLEARRYLRNELLRVSFLLLPLMVGVSAFVGYATGSVSDLSDGLFQFLFFGLFGTGVHIIQGGPNLFSYEGEQLDAIQSRPVPIQDRMQGRWLFLALVALVLFALPLPVMLWQWSPFVLFHAAFFLYNIGVLTPLMLSASVFNRKSIDANQHSMVSSPGMTVGRVALMLPAFGLPALLSFLGDLLGGLVPALGLIGGLGFLSTVAWPLWHRGLAALYRRNRHAMARGFRASRE
jgi:hypothetical protein